MSDLKESMRELLVDEPSSGLDVQRALAGGRAARRARRVRAGVVAGLAIVAAAVLVPALQSVVARGPVEPVTPGPGARPVVYEAGQGLALVGDDGSGVRPLVTQSVVAGFLADWSPDGRTLAFVRRDTQTNTTDIWTIARDGSGARRLIDCVAPCESAEDPAWSPDGTRIAYWTTGDSDITQRIVIADSATGRVLQTIQADAYVGPTHPRWSPDGRSLAVTAGHYVGRGNDQRQDGSAIGVIDLSASAPSIRLLTPFTSLASYPAWSPRGDRIMFVAGNLDPLSPSSPGASNLFTVAPDGGPATQLTRRGANDPRIADPDWTSGSPEVLVTLGQSGRTTLATLDADGTGLTELVDPLTGDPVAGTHPRRSPAPR